MLYRSTANQGFADRLSRRRKVLGAVQGLALGILGLQIPAAVAATPIEIAQLNPSPSIFSEPPFNRVPRPPQAPDQSDSNSVSPSTSTSPLVAPDIVMTLVKGQANLRFVNESGAAIDYQVIDNTADRTLAGRSEVTLQALATPTTLTFRRQDSGFLQVALAEQPQTGTLTITVRETPDFATDRTSIYIDAAGGVFLN